MREGVILPICDRLIVVRLLRLADPDAPGHPLVIAPPPKRDVAGRLDVAGRTTLALALHRHRWPS